MLLFPEKSCKKRRLYACSVVFLVCDSDLGLEHADLGERNVSALKVVVMLEGDIAGVPTVIRRAVCFLEA
jgi:hypothetical protein